MAMQLGGKGGVKSDINVTPLVDVMLVLLIIMMIIAPMLQKGVDVKLPTATNTAGQAGDAGADGRRGQRGRADALEPGGGPRQDMPQRLTDVLETKKEKIVYLKADQDAQYGRVMAAFDALRKAKVENIGLIAERKAQQHGGDRPEEASNGRPRAPRRRDASSGERRRKSAPT